MTTTFYITFGHGHQHQYAGITLDKDIVGAFKALDEDRARAWAQASFGLKYSRVLTERPDLSFFPRGMMNLDEASLYGGTAEEWLRRWDAGDPVWTIEMGGLGPGYEQVIHIACAEVIREMLGKPLPEPGDKPGWKLWRDQADVGLHRADKMPNMGMSGAQAGAAANIAFNLMRDGPAEMFRKLKQNHPDRAKDMIQVCKVWPGGGA